MRSKGLRIPDYLAHILDAIQRIENYTADLSQHEFVADPLRQDAVIRNIEIIGEAANNISKASPQYASKHSHIPWRIIYAMRNQLTHGYFDVDLDTIWITIERDLPELERSIRVLLNEFQY